MAEIVPMEEWRQLAPEGLRDTVLVLGASDSGKKPPGALARRAPHGGGRQGRLDRCRPRPVGPRSPHDDDPGLVGSGGGSVAGADHLFRWRHLLPALVGVFRLRERALASGASTVLIDSSGFIAAAAGGGALKEWEIELLRPAACIAVPHERELEHLLGPLRRRDDLCLHILPPSPHLRPRSPAARSADRRQRFRTYFAAAKPLRLPLRGRPVYGLEKAAPGRLLGLLDAEGFALALGILIEHRHGRMDVLTSLADDAAVAAVRFGDLRVDAATGEDRRPLAAE